MYDKAKQTSDVYIDGRISGTLLDIFYVKCSKWSKIDAINEIERIQCSIAFDINVRDLFACMAMECRKIS